MYADLKQGSSQIVFCKARILNLSSTFVKLNYYYSKESLLRRLEYFIKSETKAENVTKYYLTLCGFFY